MPGSIAQHREGIADPAEVSCRHWTGTGQALDRTGTGQDWTGTGQDWHWTGLALDRTGQALDRQRPCGCSGTLCLPCQ